MKLIFAIINNDDGAIVAAELIKAGFQITKMASTGGFLKRGNTTFMSAVENEKVDEVIDIIRRYSEKRTFVGTNSIPHAEGVGVGVTPVQISVGGATIFVTNIERFERI